MRKQNSNNLEYSESRNIKSWLYIAMILTNVVAFVLIGAAYFFSNQSYSQKLIEENIRNVDSLNAAAANAAYTYINSMGIKIDDIVSFVESNSLDYEQTVDYLDKANTDTDRQFQLVLSGSYGSSGALSFGDYSGVSIRKIRNSEGGVKTRITPIQYGSGYYEIFSSFTDINDESGNGMCFAKEFTDPDTKRKCFATYRHLELKNSDGETKLYTVLLVINSQTALTTYNMQSEYDGQSSVLVNEEGDYIIKNTEFRNANFYDYITNYNGLTFEDGEKLKLEVSKGATQDESVELFYKNYKGNDCIFSFNATGFGWYSITCVPTASFSMVNTTVNYALIILLLFVFLFFIDAAAIYYIGRVLRYNINVAERASKEANNANMAKSRFLSTMSHELRTPLNAVIGLVALSEDSISNPSVLRNYLKKIDISSKLLLQLISDILDVSAIESNKMKLSSSEFDIAKLITSLSAIYYDQCASKNIEFEVSLKNMSSTAVIGDSVRVNQVLLNFLSNAVKFTPGGGKVLLRAEQLQRDDSRAVIRFEVEDTGCGISDEMRARLFKPFERENSEKARKYTGTGLGLSISKNLVELMNGTVGVESVEGEGSHFWAEIPFVVPENTKRRSFNPISNLCVLGVINGADEKEYLGQMLTGFGVKHSLLDTADEVIEFIKEDTSSDEYKKLCILDWKMADFDALTAAAKIKSELGDKSPRIMVLAYDIADASSRCTQAGADFIFGKPVFPSALYNSLSEIAGNRFETITVANKNINMGGKRVLLVEDNSLNTEIAKLLLEKVGIEVETAEDGKEGCDRFLRSASGYYDAILMDVQMPVMNGYEAAQTIRSASHPQAKTIPILAMTADAFAEDVEKATKAGMNEHISKPVVPENLYAVLKQYFN